MTTLSLVSASDDAFSSCLGGGRSWDLPLPPSGLSTKPARGCHHQVVMLKEDWTRLLALFNSSPSSFEKHSWITNDNNLEVIYYLIY